jgi:hypothetical protein
LIDKLDFIVIIDILLKLNKVEERRPGSHVTIKPHYGLSIRWNMSDVALSILETTAQWLRLWQSSRCLSSALAAEHTKGDSRAVERDSKREAIAPFVLAKQ